MMKAKGTVMGKPSAGGLPRADYAASSTSTRSMKAAAVVLLGAFAVLAAGCARSEKPPTYEAEKKLFKARKYASELTFPSVNSDFLGRTLEAYRRILSEYSGSCGTVEGMDTIIVTARTELAELEFRASMFGDAREDFLLAYSTSGGKGKAAANALWSAAFISRETGDPDEALRLFTKFHEQFLTEGKIIETADLNARYLLTPIRIAEIYTEKGNPVSAAEWLDEAVAVCRVVIDSNAPDEVRKEARYDLVSALLLSKKWTEARNTIREMRNLYSGEADIPSLLYLEARVELDGFGDRERAVSLFDSLAAGYPDSKEAPSALLMKGNILFEEKRYDEAAAAYETVLEKYGGSGPEAAEARWQLAVLEESRGNWLEASLNYKSVYTDFPTTIQGMEAPLRIAAHFRKTGEREAMEAAYERAAEHYRHLSSTQQSEMVRIVAEEYLVRTLVERQRWEDAATRLLELTDMYPQYRRFRDNYLMAASIYETELDDPQRAIEILRACASKYPGTPLADEALKQIDRIRGAG